MLPIEVTWLPMDISRIYELPENQSLPIPLPSKVTLVRFSQEEKTELSKVVRLEGIVTEVRPKQLEKAL